MNLCEFSAGRWNWLNRCSVVARDLCSLTLHACLGPFSYVATHGWPHVAFRELLLGGFDAWVR